MWLFDQILTWGKWVNTSVEGCEMKGQFGCGRTSALTLKLVCFCSRKRNRFEMLSKKKKGKYWRTCLIVGFLPLIGNRFRDVSVRIFDTAHFKKGSPAGIWQPGVNLNLSSCCLLKCPRGPHRLDATVESRCFLSPSEGTWDCPQPNEDAAAAHPADTGGSPSPTDLPSAHRPRGPPGSRRAGRGEQAVPALPGGSSGLAAASRAGSR